MPKYLSGRQKLRPSDKLTEDRYQYLGLDQAEPNLADPLTSPGVPGGTQYQLVAVAGYDGRRYWVPVGGAVIPGAITVFDEGSPVSSASSITQLNFVGAAVTANVNVQSPSGHPGIAATVTVIPVNVGDNPPNTPTPNEGELWWESDTGDLYIYYNDGDSSQWVMTNSGGRGLTGDKGEIGPKGEKGQKGELGNTGSQGDKGEKGAPSTVAGDKGQKGEIGVGDKGQKGEASTVAGDKGAKGEVGVGQKGQKGDDSAAGAQVTISDTAPGSANNGDLWWESDTFDLHVYYADGSSNQWVSITSNSALKGEKGEKGATGGTGGTGDKGTKGEPSTTAGSKGEKGQKGDLNDKGQKGAAGSDLASVPSGGIILWSGAANAIPSGWYLCNGSNSTPNLSGKFVVGYSASDGDFDVNDTGGSKDAILVSHTHNLQNHVHGFSASTNSAGAHTHSFSAHFSQTSLDNDEGNATIYPNLSSSNTDSAGGHAHTVSGNTGTPSTNTTDTLGESATGKNLPPYYALCYIMKA